MKLTRRISLALIAAMSVGIAATGSSTAVTGRNGAARMAQEFLLRRTCLPSGPSKNIKWKTAIDGRGHSSPIVWENKIFLTTAIEGDVVPGAKAPTHMMGDKEFVHPDSVGANKKHTFKVIALNRDTGKILWQSVAFEGTPYDDRHRKSSYAASTPATDGKMVFAFFGSEGLYAYDFNGKLAWKADMGKLGTVGMGTGTSPIVFENLVIVQADEENATASFIVGFDKKPQGSVADAAEGTELVHAVARQNGETRGIDHQRNRVDHLVRSGNRKRTLDTQGCREQCDSVAGRQQRNGVSRCGLSSEDRNGDSSRRQR